MMMAPKELNRRVPLDRSYRGEDGSVLFRLSRDMANNEEEINTPVSNRLLEPRLLDRLFNRRHNGIVVIPLKIEQEPERHNPDSLHLGGELLEPLGKRHDLTRFRIDDIDVRGKVVALEVRYSRAELSLRRVLLVELMVSRAKQVNMLLFQKLRGIHSLGV
ncbi:hypothetical protein H106_02590 [Trichophyton rubrum CBS 735.88]|nr:hypothetical protein H106_02590 [Trichophyton rubrum CBS 735.88]